VKIPSGTIMWAGTQMIARSNPYPITRESSRR
jgi:hypothetical protein